MDPQRQLAFYDLDGTLISSNVVTQYAFFVRRHPSRLKSAFKYTKLLLSVPILIGLDLYSRRQFNRVFFRAYRGMRLEWLEGLAGELFQHVMRPAIFPGAKELVERDRAQGLRTVLVTGSPDFAIGPLVRHFGFEDVICNRLVYRDGAATGELAAPLIAEAEKVNAMRQLTREHRADASHSYAYSDSFSDVAMLESVGHPAAVNPDRRLKRIARARGWPVLDLKNGNHHS